MVELSEASGLYHFTLGVVVDDILKPLAVESLHKREERARLESFSLMC